VSTVKPIVNFVDGQWKAPEGAETLEVHNPATAEVLAQVPLSPPEEVDRAAQAAAAAFPGWRRTPPTERVQLLFKLKNLMEEHFEELSRSVVVENG
jgi:malonate-semialdehyde dehydrogenase (acetylating)/methylmalonate-semialdehyde dehydrogenase